MGNLSMIESLGVRQSSGISSTPNDRLLGRQADFAAVMARSKGPIGSEPGAEEKAAKEAAQEFVAVSLIQPLLKQLRETSNAAAPFAPSSGEKQFRSMADAQLAQRMARAQNLPLVESMARSLLKREVKLDPNPEGREFKIGRDGLSVAEQPHAIALPREPQALPIAKEAESADKFFPIETK